ncbi:MAG: LacI family DNA-binding transcriptional regulator, partial [Deinococcota bacterium]
MATIREVARHANVSPSTVSRVLNGTAAVNNETKQRVLHVIQELNYQPNQFARGLVTNRSGGIGVVVNKITSPYYGGMLEGIEAVVQEHDMHLIVSSGHSDALQEKKAVEYLKQQHADALIIHLEATSDYELLEWLEHKDFQGMPVILLGRYVAELRDQCIHLDNEQGGYLATKHLIDCGHVKIAHISGPLRMKDSRDRLQGYRRALETSGLSFDEDYVIEGQFSAESGQAAMKRLLD